MPQALPLSTYISQVSQNKTKARINRVQFGDGYAQEAREGLNTFPDSWSITYQNVSSTELQTILTALKTVTGVDYFTWQSPVSAASQKWRVTNDGWTISPVSGDYYTISFNIVEWFV